MARVREMAASVYETEASQSDSEASDSDTSEGLSIFDLEAALAIARMQERERRKAAGLIRKPTPQEQRRRSLQDRLRKLRGDLEGAVEFLERVHSDRSGLWHYAFLPLAVPKWKGYWNAPGLEERIERVRKEAAGGCELSEAFLREWDEAFRLCDHLRHLRPPPRAADYRAEEGMTPYQREVLLGDRNRDT